MLLLVYFVPHIAGWESGLSARIAQILQIWSRASGRGKGFGLGRLHLIQLLQPLLVARDPVTGIGGMLSRE